MQEFRKPHTTKKTHYAVRFGVTVLTTIALFGVSCFAVSATWGMYGTFKVAAAGRDQTEAQLSTAQQDEAQMSATVGGFNSPDGIDREARERFGVARPDEGEIDIVRNTITPAVEEATSSGNPIGNILHSLFSL
ncbi:MAG TPA: hypothetical protein VG753_00960 [Candidatus Paceibacterota bacterium]|nr:hypothetical protein [Candidatus Paceibacterota bacterium]